MLIDHFSPETIEKLGHYVYRLIDPRNGNTFYVGVGNGNRVFEHVKGAIKYKEDEDSASLKIGIINEIMAAGLQVIHVIQRYGMSRDSAFEVEAALIDCYPGLANAMRGRYSSQRGIISAYEIEHQTKLPVFDPPKDLKFMIIKTTAWKDDGWASKEEDRVYESTRKSWTLNLNRAREYKYVLSVANTVVVEVYEVDSWYVTPNSKRKHFVGKVAPNEIREIFVNKRIQDRFTGKGMSNPVLYSHD
jgi:hypothetical protein